MKTCVGVALGHGGTVAFADPGTHRVSVYGLDGSFRQCVGVGKLSGCAGVTVGARGEWIVADTGHDRVCVFGGSAGVFERQWGSPGRGARQFSGPRLVATHGPLLYVMDTDTARVQVFG